MPALHAQWKAELAALDASSDVEALQRAVIDARADYDAGAKRVSAARTKAAPKLAEAVTRSMQQLGMTGGRFEITLPPTDAPQSFGLESTEFLVAGHAGSTPRPLGKVASGGELSRIALAVAVVTSERESGNAEAAGARSRVDGVAGEARTAEIARMLGGEKLSSTSLAHAEEMLAASAVERPAASRKAAQ